MHKRFVGLAKLVGCLFFVTAILISVSCKSPLDVQAVGYVTVDFSTGQGASRAAGVLPADIKSVVISVKADDMDEITKTLTAPALSATLDVPAGAARQFEVVARNADELPLYHGKQTLDIEAGAEHALSVTMNTLYKLLYDPNGATSGAVPGTLYLAAADVVTVAPNSGLLVKTGFTFGGWYTQIGGVNTTYVAGANLTMPAGDVVLFAKWDPLSSAKDITAFGFALPGAVGVFTGTSIAVTVPYGTDVTSLSPVVTHTGTGISPALDSAINFSAAVTFIVAAADSTTKTYTVTVTVAPNTAKQINAFSFATPPSTGIITGTAIAVSVPSGTIVTNLTPSIIFDGQTCIPGPGVPRDYTNPVTYTVTAADASTQVYTVTVTVAPSADATLSSLVVNSLSLVPSMFNSATTSYTANASSSFPTVSVTPTKTQAGASIQAKINGGGYVSVTSGTASGTMMLDDPSGNNVIYVLVTAEDGTTTMTYTVAIAKTVAVTVMATANGTVTMDGISGGTYEKTPGTPVAIVATPMPGCVFQNWTGDGVVANPTSASTILTVSTVGTTTFANFVLVDYTVSYDAQGGTPTPSSYLVTYGSNYMSPPGASRSGYTFAGWWTGPNGTGIQVSGGTVMTTAADHSLYANWTINQYTVNYNANGATLGSPPGSQTADYNTSITVSDNIGSLIGPIIQDGIRRRFIGWDTVAGSGIATYVAGNTLLLGAADVWLYAQYQTTPAIIGQVGPADGLVFYDQLSIINGWQYLEVSMVDQGALGVQAWSNITATLGTTLPGVGEGLANTAAIITQAGHTSSAALLCDNYVYAAYTDWYLPSFDELNWMYTNLKAAVPLPLGNFSGEYYWSSSEGLTMTFAYRVHFTTGGSTEVGKTTLNPMVRAIRRF